MPFITVNKYSVKYSLRDPHGAHTVTFTHVGQGVSGDHISKIHLNSIIYEDQHLLIQLDYRAHDHIKITPWERDKPHCYR